MKQQTKNKHCSPPPPMKNKKKTTTTITTAKPKENNVLALVWLLPFQDTSLLWVAISIASKEMMEVSLLGETQSDLKEDDVLDYMGRPPPGPMKRSINSLHLLRVSNNNNIYGAPSRKTKSPEHLQRHKDMVVLSYTFTCMHAHAHTCVHAHTHMHACMHTHICTCVCTRTHTHTHTLSLSLSLSLTHTCMHPVSLSVCLSVCLSFSLSLSLPTLSLSHTHACMHPISLSPYSLSPPPPTHPHKHTHTQRSKVDIMFAASSSLWFAQTGTVPYYTR